MDVEVPHADLEGRQELRRSLAFRLALAFLPIAWFGWYRTFLVFPWRPELMLLPVIGAVLVLAAVRVARFSPRLLGSVVILVPTLAVYAAAGRGYSSALPFATVPVAASAFLLSPSASVVMAALLCIGTHLSPPLAGPEPWLHHFLLLSTGLVSAVMADYLGGLLEQAWTQTERGIALVRKVRASQEEISRLNKALKTSNGLLKRSLAELAEAQREAQEARHLKEQFANTVSHELRTPLNIILGFIDVIQRYPEVYGDVHWTPDLMKDLVEIERSARYLSSLVDDVLDLARIQALKMPIHKERTDLASLISEVAGLTSRLLLGKSSVVLETEVPDGLPELYVDRTRIRQVLLNLLANSCRFTSAGRICIRAVCDLEEVTISVSDTGRGIDPQQLATIFDEFRQETDDRGYEGEATGKGLGLAIARRFVQLHGGRMWAESDLGRGSVFSFTLPLAPKQVIRVGESRVPEEAMGDVPKSVVLVGDSEAGDFLKRQLADYEVICTDSVHEARKLLGQTGARAVVMNIPPQPETAQESTPAPILPERVPLIQCSLPVGPWYREQELFDGWLVKPVTAARLLGMLRQVTETEGGTPGAAASTAAREGKPLRVFLVDDDRAFVRLVRRILEAQPVPYDVRSCHTGEEAIRLLASTEVDVILLDLALPGCSGRTVAKSIRLDGDGYRPAIVAVTAIQPGLEGQLAAPHSFTVTHCTGFGQEEVLSLLRLSLEALGRANPVSLPDPAPRGEPLDQPV